VAPAAAVAEFEEQFGGLLIVHVSSGVASTVAAPCRRGRRWADFNAANEHHVDHVERFVSVVGQEGSAVRREQSEIRVRYLHRPPFRQMNGERNEWPGAQ
jgi:hypothetical protein